MLSLVSTWMGDRLGTLDAVGFSFLPFLVSCCLFWPLFGHFLATHAIPKSQNVPKTSSTFFPLDNRGRWRTFASKTLTFEENFNRDFKSLSATMQLWLLEPRPKVKKTCGRGFHCLETQCGECGQPRNLRKAESPDPSIPTLLRHRFSAFWLRSKCSICSYQLNIWYVAS